MLRRLVNDKADYIRAVCGLYEAYSENDTIVAGGISIPMLRQQKKSEKDEYLCLSDFIAPVTSGKKDYIGAFAVTAGFGAEELLKVFESDEDEYAALLLKSLSLTGRRLQPNGCTHDQDRVLGICADEKLSIADMLHRDSGELAGSGYPSIRPDDELPARYARRKRSGSR